MKSIPIFPYDYRETWDSYYPESGGGEISAYLAAQQDGDKRGWDQWWREVILPKRIAEFKAKGIIKEGDPPLPKPTRKDYERWMPSQDWSWNDKD